MTLRVVVADDHGIVREGLAAVLSAREGFELVGTATTAAEAVRAAVTLRPDVVVMAGVGTCVALAAAEKLAVGV